MKDLLHSIARCIRLHRTSLLPSLTGGVWGWVFFLTLPSQAQTIGGNVYGGGNKGNVGGNTTVTVKAGDLQMVFGGARMANVGGRAFVNINGEQGTGDIFATSVFGGNDIAGTIGTSTVPAALTDVIPEPTADQLTASGKTREEYFEDYKKDHPTENLIDDSWNVYVRTSRSTQIVSGGGEGDDTTEENYAIVIGSLYGGSNGDYDYENLEDTPAAGQTTHNIYQKGDRSAPITTKITANDDAGFNVPDLAKTYLEIKGGCISHLYGGGNNATITENTTISINNESEDLVTMSQRYATTTGMTLPMVLGYLQQRVQLNAFQADLTSYAFNFARIFGGNNKADMAITPTWNIQRGIIRDIYSGGNEGRMTSPTGLLLEIDPIASNRDKLFISNVYGGCRRADVRPLHTDGSDISVNNLPGYFFPPGLSARTLIRGGQITNVYGGNDISGTVYGGNAVGIYTSVLGNVYGGGNGGYAYTDNPDLGNNPVYSDFYYPKGSSSVESLNAFRPNAEQVSIRLFGTEDQPTIIHGSVFCGGNSASLATKKEKTMVELKIGSYVIADKVFLGNDGSKMVNHDILRLYAGSVDDKGNLGGENDYSSLDLTNQGTMSEFMEGVAMNMLPSVVFDNVGNNDQYNYIEYTSKIGSFYCGGNVGSMTFPGKNTYNFEHGLVIFDKLVGGCNNANVEAQFDSGTQLCAAYEGGILGTKEERANYTVDGTPEGAIKDRIEINLSNLIIEPRRWTKAYVAVRSGTELTQGNTYYTSNTGSGAFVSDGTEVANGSNYYELSTAASRELEWNTLKWDESTGAYEEIGVGSSADTGDDQDRRLFGGNVYGGCYESGHVNGNVTININQNLIQKDQIFAGISSYDEANNEYTIDESQRNTGVVFENQRDDLEEIAMSVFGAGYGEATEIWGSTNVNLNNGYSLQVFGGGEQGVVGKGVNRIEDEDGLEVTYRDYSFDARYSSTVNLNGPNAGYSEEEESGPALAATEYIYGGGNEGDVCGNTYVYLGDGRSYGVFGGASNADIYGHSELYIGIQKTGENTFRDGFPWISANVFGGNDFSGEIKDKFDFTSKIRNPEVLAMIHNPKSKLTPDATPDVLMANVYVEYLQGRVDSIFGGSYGYYDYSESNFLDEKGNPYPKPKHESTFVHLRPDSKIQNNPGNSINGVFGGSTGYPSARDGDQVQNRSYVLVDIPDDVPNFQSTLVFGAGSYDGLGMKDDVSATMDPSFDPDQISAIIDLVHGKIGNVFGGSYNEGVTARTVINVPTGSTINVQNIFGGAFGTNALPPCDVFESNVNYRSADAIVSGAIYGGNNNVRRTLYSKVNVSSPVYNGGVDKKTGKRYLGTIYGAGYGTSTWSEYTEVNLENGARVYEVYGGGQKGQVLNAESIQKYMEMFSPDKIHSVVELPDHIKDTFNGDISDWATLWKDAWTLGDYYEPNANFDNYATNSLTNLSNSILVREAEMDDRTTPTYKYNTNVIIHEGATVENYAYGGGLGDAGEANSGDIIGTTYIALLGGTVVKDIYAAGTVGSVYNIYGGDFMASANAYIKGGSCRNVYGAGWNGSVGFHAGAINASTATDIPAETHVVIGDLAGTSFTNGVPTVQRNAYGGGEGGPVYGSAYLTLNNGYVGYEYKEDSYVENIEDETYTDKETGEFVPNDRLYDSGCIFGGGYIDNSNVDKTFVTIYDGHVRNSVFGGGEIAAIGRGTTRKVAGKTPVLEGIYRPGKTMLEMFGGHVHRNVYGGGRGYNNLNEHGKLNCDGYVFGQTEVHIHGGVVGTLDGLSKGYGNVFGGGDVGFVYSAYENPNGTFEKGVKSGVRYDGLYQGYYYKHVWDNDNDVEDQFLHENGDERIFTEDCKVLVAPSCKTNAGGGLSFTNIHYGKGETVASIDYEYLAVNNNLDGISSDQKVTAEEGITFSRTYPNGSYVPIAALNTLKNKNADDRWASLDPTGVIIHNAVFAGGNTSTSSNNNANTTTVYGNATASIHDAYHRDLITLGSGHIGGLYGDGNLTFVDGYRELNITNYGTDYYSIADQITIDQYHALPDREAAYYELIYTCKKLCTDKEGSVYRPGEGSSKASTITADDFLVLFYGVEDNGVPLIVTNEKGELVPNSDYWDEKGVLPLYAGRLMNSIQRADFCGVWGSRMVMRGAEDRVVEEVDYTKYTINRVREVSLNKKISTAGDAEGSAGYMHGNYFGIYNIVNYLGALTSDFNFGGEDTTGNPDDGDGDVRKTDNNDAAKYKCDAGEGGKAYGTATFYDWKKAYPKDRRRNNGNSHNKVALASGVYLELTTELSTGTGLREKDWGLITGVIELDLINVAPGIGGGFVYAKNEHGIRKKTNHLNTTLTALNKGAVTQYDYEYDTYTPTEDDKREWQTSGNFVHSSHVIIDDCYNVSHKYKEPDAVPAHYWYIKGSVYVYDQYISAYTGIPNAYSEQVEIPLTISAASYGKMKLLDVQENVYAYFSSPGVPLGDNNKVVINDNGYYRNDPVSYWDYYLMGNSEKELFTKDTYVNCVTYYDADGTKHEAGTVVMTAEDFNTYKQSSHTFNDAEGHAILDADKNVAGNTYIFRQSNNASHDQGYILTYTVNNPSIWDTWYTQKSGSHTDKLSLADYNDPTKNTLGTSAYHNGPTYHLKSGEGNQVLGQNNYERGDVISATEYNTYQDLKNNLPSGTTLSGQAEFTPAYIVTEQITITDPETHSTTHLNPGSLMSQSDASAYSSETTPAFVCTRTIQLSKTDFIILNSKMSGTEKTEYINTVKGQMNAVKPNSSDMTVEEIKASTTLTEEEKKSLLSLATIIDDINTYIIPAYYCSTEGKYGGNYYVTGNNYRALEAWSSMSFEDRQKFEFNYDALDLLIDPLYSRNENGQIIHTEGLKYQYDDAAGTPAGANANGAHYSLQQPIDYTATYNSDTPMNLGTGNEILVNRSGSSSPISTATVQKDDELSRDVFEALINEQRHYTAISVKEVRDASNNAIPYYVVNTTFQIGSTIYSAGEIIDGETYNSFDTDFKENVTTLTFEVGDENKNFYFCREAYEVAEHPVKSVRGSNTTSYAVGSTVPVGAVIAADNETVGSDESAVTYTGYDNLTNQQKDFTIQGISPTEISTLYVSRNSDIYDLSKEKIITVIYQYDYEESDQNGHITPISERHVLNIHLQFKSGVPIVEEITKPDIILPGDNIILREPNVTPGAYEITGHGWELFETPGDAESHINGIDIDPENDPLYWYQHDWYIAYYAKTYLGRTYSNSVPVSVANYHDIANVMSEANQEHHMYIDRTDVLRDPKIYINDYSKSGKNGLDEFKRLYDLSVLTGYTTDHETGLITDGDFKDHKPLNTWVKGGANLEFFMRTDIDHSEPWTPIGDATQCFEGTLHGDGHTISGLDHSLFGELCGSVYNLGVKGSFTSAGVVDRGLGYVESCWIDTEGTPDGSVHAVFGNPTDDKGKQVVNCYFPETKAYNTSSNARGNAIPMPERAFYNGTVAYDLNNFYLYKRYSDKKVSAGENKVKYRYYTIDTDNKLILQEGYKYYDSSPALCSSGYKKDVDDPGIKYVEDRFSDGDFRYAEGVIPTTGNERLHIEEITKGEETTYENHFYPIWPDDYIFFGQKLTYGYSDTQTHQEHPSAVARSDGRLSLDDDANRVYRSPAYYRNSTMDVAHFNPQAYLAQTKKGDANTKAYPDMTAIDFAGHNDNTWGTGFVSDGFPVGKPAFYPPLLDDDGLLSIRNIDETRNLLAYAPAETAVSGYANKNTFDVLTAYFVDPMFDTYYADTETYKRVSRSMLPIYGHLVQSTKTATNDHLLVDKQDFNCPISYNFAAGKRMWYQRIPDTYVSPVWAGEPATRTTKGWEGVSIPFTAALVTTDQKGEITHFFDGSETSKNGTGSKIGHEYWLRNYKGVLSTSGDIVTANLSYPTSSDESPVMAKKEVTNTFLWDYYYNAASGHQHKDINDDTYQTYYEHSRTYYNYPLLGKAQAYIIGFPNDTYYEFDLSGVFRPTTTASPNPAKLEQQTITFASEAGATTIEVSDSEMGGKTADGYTFKPNYLNETLPSGYFVMNSDGDAYRQLSADDETNTTNKVSTALSAFRPYFVAGSAGVKTRSIIFSNEGTEIGKDLDQQADKPGELIIRARKRNIYVTSTLKDEANVTIVNAAGALINTFKIKPGETIVTEIHNPGIYLVNKTKLSIK